MTLLIHLAWQALEANASPVAGARAVLWVGRACWPYAHALVRGISRAGDAPAARERAPPLDRRLLHASIFIDPPDHASSVWAIDLGLRTGAVVIADGSRLDMTSSRRLQLAAEAGQSGLALLARPPRELQQLSAAATRWRVRPAPGGVSPDPRWTVELIRCKGVQPRPDSRREWTLELDRARRIVCVLPPVADRPAAPARQTA